MKIITNERKKKRNRRIAIISTLIGMAILISGLVISLRFPDQVTYSLLALLLGFLFAQIGIFFTNRWGRNPSTDVLINQALKGLDQKYTLCHYYTPTYHLLSGPAGIWILYPYHLTGTITYKNGRWRHKGSTFLRFFGKETLGRPDLELPYEIEKIQKFLKPLFAEETPPPVRAALVFTNPKITLEIDPAENPPAPSLHLDKLKDFLRKEAKQKPISLEKVEKINAFLAQYEEGTKN
ncbi:MAG: hypothetical protein RML93_02370 [Anaerolineales bacterium]|nr:ETRAMP family protein [Anaerolineales bacterium]MCS7246835.1 ETRAMP family protein [Anaerolineales bacterium]MDW8160645.1 hypothetical protein [Anaerolineales bacterium]MDW8446120.1 hypothetical protein [Anaerolineales bacterium]